MFFVWVAAGKAALHTIFGAVGEGAEEFIAELGQSYINKLTIGTDTRNWKELNKDAWYNALVGGITALLFDTADIISGGNGILPTAEDFESVTAQAAEEAANSIAVNAAVLGGNAENLQLNSHRKSMATSNYTVEQAMRIRWEGKTFRNIVAGIDTSVSNFFQKWNEGRKSHLGEKLEKLYLGALNEAVLGKVEDVLGYAVDYRDVIVTNDDVKHILRGHPNLEGWVFDALPAVIASPDFVGGGHEGTGKNSGKTGVIMKKTMPNGTVVTIQFDNPGRSTLQITTVYTKESTTPMVTEKSDTPTPKATEPVLSQFNISQAKNEVNGKVANEPSQFLYMERLAEQAKKNGNLYTQRILRAEIEKARKNFGKSEAEASTPMSTIYADYMREYNMPDDYEAETENGEGFEELNADLENDANSDTMNREHVRNLKLTQSGKVINPMPAEEYEKVKDILIARGVEVFAAISGDDLGYMLAMGAEGTYSNGRITHVGAVPSRGTMYEELIHMMQAKEYGELDTTDYVELYRREIEANRKLIEYSEHYKLDTFDISDIKRNLKRWEESFAKAKGVAYDDFSNWN